MVACEECSWSKVTELRWYRWLELRSLWRCQQYGHFDTTCQRPKGKLHFLFVIMMSVLHVYFRHLPAMSIKAALHSMAPLLYPCRTHPKCPWGLYDSPPPVAMAVVGWFLCFSAFCFFFGKRVFFSICHFHRKKSLRVLHQKNISSKKNTIYTKKKLHGLRLFPHSSYAFLPCFVSPCIHAKQSTNCGALELGIWTHNPQKPVAPSVGDMHGFHGCVLGDKRTLTRP